MVAAIFRMCTDTIIKPDGSVVVLETGAFPTSAFTGHDRHNPPLTKRQEAMRDLSLFAESHNLPLYILGSPELLEDEYKTNAKEKGGLYWDNEYYPNNYYTSDEIDQLKKEIENLPIKQFDPANASTYRCILVSLAHIHLGIGGMMSQAFNIDALTLFRSIEGVLVIDDKQAAIYNEIFDSKIINSSLIPEKFMPKTLMLARQYEPGLADKIIAHFHPSKKILIKPSHAARGSGIIILSLANPTHVDQQLRQLLQQEHVTENCRQALVQLNLNSSKNPEHYWLKRDPMSEPTLILQDFIDSEPVTVDEKRYQAITRFVFTCIYTGGATTTLFHGRPYHKLAALPLGSANAQACSISKVHEETGPEPIIMADKRQIGAIEQQLTECFNTYCLRALELKTKKAILDKFIACEVGGLQAYAMVLKIKYEILSSEDSAKIKEILLRHTGYLDGFFRMAANHGAIADASSPFYRLVQEMMQRYPLSALRATSLDERIFWNFSLLLREAIAPQFDTLWATADAKTKLQLFSCMIRSTEFIKDEVHEPIDFPSIEMRDNLLGKLSELIASKDAEVAIPALLWSANTAINWRCTSQRSKCDADHPMHKRLRQLCDEYQQQSSPDNLSNSYLTLQRLFRDDKQHLSVADRLRLTLDSADTIVAHWQQGIGPNIRLEDISFVFMEIRCILRDINAGEPALLRQDPRALKTFLLTTWMKYDTPISGIITEGIVSAWFQSCRPFVYLWKNFEKPQQVVNAAWNLGLNTLISCSGDDLGILRSLHFIEMLIANNFIISNPEKNLENHAQIKAYILNQNIQKIAPYI